jgi:hypothetical protein
MTDRTGFDLVTSRPLSPEALARAVAMAAEEAKEKDSAKKPKKPRKDKKEAKP